LHPGLPAGRERREAGIQRRRALISQAFRVVCVLLLVCGFSSSALAQDGGARISGFYAGAFGEGETNAAAGGSVGYRFNSRFGFDFEALALPDFKIGDLGDGGRGVAFLTNFVTEFPGPARWLTPYVQGGGGVANLRQSSDIAFEDNDGRRFPIPTRDRRQIGRGLIPPTRIDDMQVIRVDGRRSDTSLALSVGGGVDFTFWKGLAVGPNITFTKLFGNLRDIELTRIGGRASYRF
jgi:opacity protein-like surface antigen